MTTLNFGINFFSQVENLDGGSENSFSSSYIQNDQRDEIRRELQKKYFDQIFFRGGRKSPHFFSVSDTLCGVSKLEARDI